MLFTTFSNDILHNESCTDRKLYMFDPPFFYVELLNKYSVYFVHSLEIHYLREYVPCNQYTDQFDLKTTDIRFWLPC